MRNSLRLAACCVLLLSGVAPLARAQAPDPIDSVLRDARAQVDAGKPAAAVAALRAAGHADDPRVVELLGVALYHSDDYAAAIDTLRGVVDKLPAGSAERREAEQVLGLSLYFAGRFPEAIPLLERTRVWATGNLELAYVLGTAYVQVQRPDEARAAFASLFGVPPDSAAAHVLTAQMMVRLELEALASAELNRAIEKDPRIPRANYLLGQQAIFRGRLEEGIERTRRELAINPSDAMALYQLGDAYSRQGRWDESIVALQQSLWINPFYSGPYILLGKAYMKKDQLGTAEGMLRRAIGYDPNNRTAHYMLGQLLQQLGRTDEAKQELAIAEKLTGVR